MNDVFKNIKIDNIVGYSSLVLFVLYISAFLMKVGEMFFLRYPYQLFTFTANDFLEYSLKPLLLIISLFILSFLLDTINKKIGKWLHGIYMVALASMLITRYLITLPEEINLIFNVLFIAVFLFVTLFSVGFFIDKDEKYIKVITFIVISLAAISIPFGSLGSPILVIYFSLIIAVMTMMLMKKLIANLALSFDWLRFFHLSIIYIIFLVNCGFIMNMRPSANFLTDENGLVYLTKMDSNMLFKGCKGKNIIYEIRKIEDVNRLSVNNLAFMKSMSFLRCE